MSTLESGTYCGIISLLRIARIRIFLHNGYENYYFFSD